MTRERVGLLHWAFPAMLGLVALTVFLSGRDLSQTLAELETGTALMRHPALIWVQRLVSLLMVVIAAERIASHFMERRHLPSPALALAFIAYWLATVAFPAVFGSHPRIAHEYLYTLGIGLAAVLAGARELDKVVTTCRNALFAFLLAGFLLVPLNPSMVLDSFYAQGLLPGVPRFGGLAPHAVALGMFAQIALLCLWARPFRRRSVNVLAWGVGGAALFLAQSKNAWMSFLLCAVVMLVVRNGGRLWRRVGDPRQDSAGGIVACLALMGVVVLLLGWYLFGDVEGQAAAFLSTSEGAQLMTLTGRDRIWAVAIEEWQANRLFGYGPGLWDPDFRASIGMPNATNAHNQFMDTLARSGTVGAVALVLYAGVLLALSLRYARATGGLSLTLFLAIALRSISEVPLLLFGYGTELFSHLLLIAVLAGGAASYARTAPAARPHSFYRVAS
jgi:O-antigen ligase